MFDSSPGARIEGGGGNKTVSHSYLPLYRLRTQAAHPSGGATQGRKYSFAVISTVGIVSAEEQAVDESACHGDSSRAVSCGCLVQPNQALVSISQLGGKKRKAVSTYSVSAVLLSNN